MFADADLTIQPWKRWQCKGWADVCTLSPRGYHYWDGTQWWEVVPGSVDPLPRGVRLPCLRGRGAEAPREALPAAPPSAPAADLLDRARRYVERMPPAIAGSGGSTATFKVAVTLVRGFALEPADAMALLVEYNARCLPPWSMHDLKHQVRQAMRSRQPRGYLAERGR